MHCWSELSFFIWFIYIQNDQQIFVFVGLVPKIYEIRVSTINDPDPEWTTFNVSVDKNYTMTPTMLNKQEPPLVIPSKLEGVAKSSTSVSLNWHVSDENVKFFTVCYYSLNENQSKCNEDGQFKRWLNNVWICINKIIRIIYFSDKNEITIENLEPNTTYKFKVQSYNEKEQPGLYSQAVEVHTPEEGKYIFNLF